MAVLYLWRVFQPQVGLRTWLAWLWNSVQLTCLGVHESGSKLKSMLDIMAVLWLVWLVPQPTCCFFQSQMSIFGSLASKKKMVGEPYYIANILSLDTWKREQGLSMFDKRRSTPVGTHLFFERRREKLRQPKKKLAKSWRWFYLTSNICSRGQADPKLSAPSPTRKEVSLITKHFFRRKHQHPSQSRWTSSPRSNLWCGLAGKSFALSVGRAS